MISNNTDDKNSTNFQVIKDEINEREASINEVKHSINVLNVLLKHKIIHFKDIERLENKKDKELLNKSEDATSRILCRMLERLGNSNIEQGLVFEHLTVLGLTQSRLKL